MKFWLGLLALLLGAVLGTARAPEKPAPQLSGERALAHVHALVALGPRPPGSEGIAKARDYIRRQVERSRIEVEEIAFDAVTPRGTVRMMNLVARIPGRKPDIVVLAGHYDTVDTRLISGFLGANDGGSSAALLLELGRTLAARPSDLTVWLVFFDGEEALREWGPRDGTYGSRYLAGRWQHEGILGRVRALILLDMIGDSNLLIRREPNSTPWLSDLVWSAARDLGHGAHFSEERLATEDDHVPFLRAGVAAVDLIDFDYGSRNRYWHSRDDTPDKLSARSFQVVGEVVLETLRRLAQR